MGCSESIKGVRAALSLGTTFELSRLSKSRVLGEGDTEQLPLKKFLASWMIADGVICPAWWRSKPPVGDEAS